jgi:anti-sigma B factor antagonist
LRERRLFQVGLNSQTYLAIRLFCKTSEGRPAMAESSYSLGGEIDLATASTLQGNLVALVNASEDDLVLDCKDLRFIDSTGISVFVYTKQLLEMHGRGFRITNLTGTARRPFDVLGLTEELGIAPDREPA